MIVEEFYQKFSKMSPEMRQKEIVIECPNGLLVEPSIKYILKDKYQPLNHGIKNIDKLVITF